MGCRRDGSGDTACHGSVNGVRSGTAARVRFADSDGLASAKLEERRVQGVGFGKVASDREENERVEGRVVGPAMLEEAVSESGVAVVAFPPTFRAVE